jgi:hypothetical protein
VEGRRLHSSGALGGAACTGPLLPAYRDAPESQGTRATSEAQFKGHLVVT